MTNNMLASADLPGVRTGNAQPAAAKGDQNRGEFAGAHIEPADNGYNLKAHFDPADPSKGYPEPAHTVHANRQDLLDHLDDVLADHEHKIAGKGKPKKEK